MRQSLSLSRFRSPAFVTSPSLRPPEEEDAGIVLTLVPQSDRAPHMSRAKGAKVYWLRNGSRFEKMEHFQVADYFGRRAQPRVGLLFTWKAEVELHGSFDPSYIQVGIQIDVMLVNEGRGLLRFPSVYLRRPAPWEFQAVHYFNIWAPYGDWWLQLGAGSELVLHQNDRVRVVHFHAAFPAIPNECSDVEIGYQALAEHSAPDEGVFRVSGEEIVAHVRASVDEHFRKFNLAR